MAWAGTYLAVLFITPLYKKGLCYRLAAHATYGRRKREEAKEMKKNIFFRAAALVLCLGLLFSMAACGDISYVAKSGDVTVTPGIYLFNLLRSMTRAANLVTDPPEDVWTAQIDGQPLEDWVIADAQKEVAKYVAVEHLAAEKGITLTEEQKTEVSNLVSVMRQYYAYYEKNGISEDSLSAVIGNQYLSEALFNLQYGPEGETPIPEADIEQYYTNKFVRFKYIIFDSNDSEGNPLEGDAKAELEEIMSTYLKKAQEDPESMDTLIAQYDAYRTAKNGKNPEDADPYSDVTVSGATNNLYHLDVTNQGTFPTDFVQSIQELPFDEPTLKDYKETKYLAIRYPLDLESEDFQNSLSMIRSGLKGEEFDAWLDTQTANYSVEYNADALKKYTPKTVKTM